MPREFKTRQKKVGGLEYKARSGDGPQRYTGLHPRDLDRAAILQQPCRTDAWNPASRHGSIAQTGIRDRLLFSRSRPTAHDGYGEHES